MREASQLDPSYKAWLAFSQIPESSLGVCRRFDEVVIEEQSDVLDTAAQELIQGLSELAQTEVKRTQQATSRHAFVLGTVGASTLAAFLLGVDRAAILGGDGYVIKTVMQDGTNYIVLAGGSDKGCFYAVFHLLRLLQTGNDISAISVVENARNPLRMIDHWDNMDGSVERGYAGKSIFFANGGFVSNLSRVRDYARLLASVGINAIAINNVNVHAVESQLITSEYLSGVAKIADIFRRFGIQLFLSVNFASPIEVGGGHTADPLDPEVQLWWRTAAERVYRSIPDFGGFLVKADSEFRPGPFTYGRDHADGANMLAAALAPFGGRVIWRCFVYNCTQDWRDRKTDRARAAYDHFTPLDGRFQDNVLLQIKNGPMDFQVREPVSPLFGGLKKTNQILELQITQEYTGQQIHVCYLVPQWKEILEFDTESQGAGSTVANIVSGAIHNRRLGGMAAVSNIGDDANWTGNVLAQANLYGYGRLAWNPGLAAKTITDEWVAMTFGTEKALVDTISELMLGSFRTYENYTAPLGVGWMVNPGNHYGPNVDGYEYSKWGTYHFADCKGIGVDRTAATGTGYAAQYHSAVAQLYEDVDTCPDELLLFFHHVPYMHVLKSGKTVIQHIYDAHFEGVEQVASMRERLRQVGEWINPAIFDQIAQRLDRQLEDAREWRDVINTYFYRKSGIHDEKGRQIF